MSLKKTPPNKQSVKDKKMEGKKHKNMKDNYTE